MKHRVVITGMGAVSPLGQGTAALREGLLAGRSGVRAITHFDASRLPSRIAGECDGTAGPLGDRKIAFALTALDEAWAAATRTGPPVSSDASVSFGVGLELFRMEDLARSRLPDFAPPTDPTLRLSFMQTPSDLVVHAISKRVAATRPPLLHVSACAAGTDAVGAAFRLVARGRRRWAIAGGTDSMVNPLGVAGFATLSATSTRNDPPERASRPFDLTRDGFVLGEGAAVLVLERREDAIARRADILGEVCGYGSSLDAYAISEPRPDGAGALAAMSEAIADAKLAPDAIDAVNAHGTGTPKNDAAETRALHALFGDRAGKVPVMATKSMIGHLISAAGAVEAVAAVLCMNAKTLHPTINLLTPDPSCDLDYVPNVARSFVHDLVLSSSFGFGGHNAAIVLGSKEVAHA